MALIVLVLLVLLIATGALFAVLKIAFAVALGVFLALMAVGAYVAWRVRRAFREALHEVGREGIHPDGTQAIVVLRTRKAS